MLDKNREFLRDKIKKFGLYQASRLFGLSMAELITVSKIKITYRYAYQVLLELIENEKIPTKYKGFTLHENEYAVRWSMSQNTDEFGVTLRESIYCLATPLYDGIGFIPIDFNYYFLEEQYERESIFEYDRYSEYQETIKVDNEFENLEELLVWYRDFYLPQVYDKIVNECLPMVRENHKEEILRKIDEYFN